ncbi:MAG: GtrA family protein [Pseudomonadota bacterium]
MAATLTPRTLWGELWRYGVTGLANTALGCALIFTCVYLLGFSVVWANVVGYSAGLCLSYVLNSRWTFRYDGRAVFAFAIVVAVAFGANLSVTLGLTEAGLAYPPAQLLGAAAYSGLMFAGLKWMVFTHD